MWHAVSALPGAQLQLGLKPGVDQEKFRAGLASRMLDDLFDVQAVRTGDTFFVTAGTPHSIGPNMVICAVQDYSALTYRVYDFGRLAVPLNHHHLHILYRLNISTLCTH